MNSCLYLGQVKHRRTRPALHQFSYRLFMMYLDLDELPYLFKPYWLWSANRFNLAWFKRSDHFGNVQQSLAESIRDRVEQETGNRPRGRVCLLTHLRYFGFGFNPVSFYYCYSIDNRLQALVAEVSNTPWGERFEYVFATTKDNVMPDGGHYSFRNSKSFHVSPFMPMDIEYRWQVSLPNEALEVNIENRREGEMFFNANLQLNRREINSKNLRAVLIQFPLVTIKVVTAIYFEALRLWLKKVPFYSHLSQPREEH